MVPVCSRLQEGLFWSRESYNSEGKKSIAHASTIAKITYQCKKLHDLSFSIVLRFYHRIQVQSFKKASHSLSTWDKLVCRLGECLIITFNLPKKFNRIWWTQFMTHRISYVVLWMACTAGTLWKKLVSLSNFFILLISFLGQKLSVVLITLVSERLPFVTCMHDVTQYRIITCISLYMFTLSTGSAPVPTSYYTVSQLISNQLKA